MKTTFTVELYTTSDEVMAEVSARSTSEAVKIASPSLPGAVKAVVTSPGWATTVYLSSKGVWHLM